MAKAKKKMLVDSKLPTVFRDIDLVKKKAFDDWFSKIGPE